jgi:uracil-DNA glycosylase
METNTAIAEKTRAAIRGCRLCPLPAESYPIVVPYTGQRFFLLGQAPGKEELKQNRPFAGAAGKTLFKWFRDAGLGTEEEVRSNLYISAVAHCWPGSRPGSKDDLPPTRQMRLNCHAHILAELQLVNPDWIVAVGTLAAETVLGRKVALGEVVGPVLRSAWAGERGVLVLPHPSGLSRWLNSPENRNKHAQVMATLAKAWQVSKA